MVIECFIYTYTKPGHVPPLQLCIVCSLFYTLLRYIHNVLDLPEVTWGLQMEMHMYSCCCSSPSASSTSSVAGALSTPAAALTQTARFRGKSYSDFCTKLLVTVLQNTNMNAELDAAMGRVGLPSNYAKDIVKQAELANGTVFNCYRSSQRPVPLALLYPEFDEFCLRCASPAGISVRDSLFCLELCQEMQHLVSKEIKRAWIVNTSKASCHRTWLLNIKQEGKALLTSNSKSR